MLQQTLQLGGQHRHQAATVLAEHPQRLFHGEAGLEEDAHHGNEHRQFLLQGVLAAQCDNRQHPLGQQQSATGGQEGHQPGG
ncbi:hypothetical protein D9M70_534550 [compost metagenome]